MEPNQKGVERYHRMAILGMLSQNGQSNVKDDIACAQSRRKTDRHSNQGSESRNTRDFSAASQPLYRNHPPTLIFCGLQAIRLSDNNKMQTFRIQHPFGNPANIIQRDGIDQVITNIDVLRCKTLPLHGYMFSSSACFVQLEQLHRSDSLRRYQVLPCRDRILMLFATRQW